MNHANFAETTLGAAITDTSGTAITVTSGTGFPTAPFLISIGTECLEVTNKGAGTDWTVVRGYESSTAATHLNGAAIFHDWSAGEADSTVHGPASATDDHLAVFDGATGKLIKDGGACTAAGLALLDDANAAAQLVTLGAAAAADVTAKLAKAGDTMTGNLIMDNMDITLVKLLTLHGEIDDGNSGVAVTIDWNAGAAHKSTLTGNVTLAFSGFGVTCVPTMSDNTTPSGVASTGNSSANAWKCFSGVLANDVGAAAIAGYFLQYQFPTSKTIIQYAIRCINYHLYSWIFQGSNNGTDWTTISTITGQNTSYFTTYYFNVATPGSYVYYRLTITSSEGNFWNPGQLYLIDTATVDPVAPCCLTLKLVQDGTGGRTVTWPATVRGTVTVNADANGVTIVQLYWDGTNYYVVNVATWTPA
jgi:hypothetical protein